MRELCRFTKHKGSVQSLGVTPDGRSMVVHTQDRMLRIYRASNGQQRLRIEADSATFSGNNRYVLVEPAEGLAELMDVVEGRRRKVPFIANRQKPLDVIALSNDARTVVVREGANVRIVEWETGQQRQCLLNERTLVLTACLSPDGRYVLLGLGGLSERTYIYDLNAGELVQQLERLDHDVLSAAFSRRGNYVVTGSIDCTARLWNVATGRELQEFRGHADQVLCVAVAPDERRILTGSLDGTARLWNAEDGVALQACKASPPGAVWAVAFSPDGRQALTGSLSVQVWDTASGRQVKRIEDFEGPVNSVAFSSDGEHVLTGGGDLTGRFWRVVTGDEVQRLRGHTRSVRSAAFTDDGSRALTSSWDGTARTWNPATGRELARYKGSADTMRFVEFFPDGRRLLIQRKVGAEGWPSLCVLDHMTGGEILSVRHRTPLVGVSFSANGRLMITSSLARFVRTFNMEQALEAWQFKSDGSGRIHVAITLDGRITFDDGETDMICVREASSGEVRWRARWTERVSCAAFSPTGNKLVLGSESGAVHIIDSATGQVMNQFQAHSMAVISVAVSPNGRLIVAAASPPGAVRVWEI